MGKQGLSWKVVSGQLILALVILGICEYIVDWGIVGSLYLSPPSQVVKELLSLLLEGDIFKNLYVTLAEFTIGYIISIFMGVGIGMFLVLVSRAEVFFSPFLSALMAVPKVTIIPLLMLWLGIGMVHKVAIVFMFCFFTIIFNTIAGIKQTAENHLKVARVFEATQFQIIMKVILPSAAPTIFAGLRVAAATGLVGALFGEMLASKEGLGNMLFKTTSLYNTAQAFALIAIVTVVSVLIIAFIDVLEKKVFLKWKSS